MYTILDYLKFYKDINIDKVHWNEMDNLMCAILVYLPLPSFTNYKNLDDLYLYSQKYKTDYIKSLMVPKSYEILELIYKSKRYRNLKIYNFTNIKNDNTQFGAATFRVENETVISYKGTDGSLIGWIENFRIAYSYPTYTHELAINYLKNSIKFYDKNIYVVGHSKGGNLAMVSAMETTNSIFNKIINIYNFDGPGLRKEEYESKKYEKLSKKLINILPKGSMIGVLLNNDKYSVVKSNAIAFSEHYPTSWNIFGEYFIQGSLSNVSERLHESTTIGIENLDNEKVKETFENIFNSIEKEYSSDIDISFDDMIKTYKNVKNIDPEISKSIDKIINSMIGVIYTKKTK